MKDYKNLTDQELLYIIDTEDVTLFQSNLKDLRELAKTDSDFRQRLLDLKNKKVRIRRLPKKKSAKWLKKKAWLSKLRKTAVSKGKP